MKKILRCAQDDKRRAQDDKRRARNDSGSLWSSSFRASTRLLNPKSKIQNLKSRITERDNPASVALDTKSTEEILCIVNHEDQRVPPAVRKVIPRIARAVELVVKALERGGRLVYIGAGTSGRLGVLDAAECVPTFGTHRVVAVMAGAPQAMFKPVEGAEDDPEQAVRDLRRLKLNRRDVLVGISASGGTPYTLAGLRYARKLRAKTVAITNNPGSEMDEWADVTIAAVVGPEVIAGSTRMKAGTAQKLILNMLSTASMVRLGRVFSGRMVSVQMTNEKLKKRGEAMLAQGAGVTPDAARHALEQSGWSLPVALLMLWKHIPRSEAVKLLGRRKNPASVLRQARAEWAKSLTRSPDRV
ncbi:MAG: N-acetylmuramic acid 6-phosphate etherase [Terriglobia bacterium]